MTPKLSIIIVNYRSADVLEYLLRSLHVATDQSFELLLVDNSGDDGAEAVLAASGFHSHYFPQPTNVGYTKAANFGAAHAVGEYLCFLNPDMVLEGHSIDRLLDWVEQHPRTVAGPREKNEVNAIATTVFPFVTRRYVWGANLLYKIPWPRAWQPFLAWLVPSFRYAWQCRTARQPFSGSVLSGACLVVSRSVWEEVGSFREELVYFGLESEWFQRAKELGISAWYIPDSVVFHEHATSIRRAVHWKVREVADENRRTNAKKFGIVTLGILVLVLWIEHRVRPRRA